MKNCHVCGFACENEADICPLCGAELKTFEDYEKELQQEKQREAEAAAEEALIIKNPVLAASVENVVVAEIYKDVLRDSGIHFTCDESDDGMHIVFGGGFNAQEIYVNESDLEIAQQLYENVVNAQTDFDDNFDGFDESEE
ncbi:MAG: DUF2007 domain-containing protein [Acutalibacteraceae bacterium]|nr:DUF2007 domain-containing protein [Acutalibacteraceae bacterium]